jgi:hypothetical protein
MFSLKIKSVPRPYHYQWLASSKSVCRKVGTYPLCDIQIFISSGAVGLGGDYFAVPGPKWWVLDVPR